jgi:hypothetical protein
MPQVRFEMSISVKSQERVIAWANLLGLKGVTFISFEVLPNLRFIFNAPIKTV